MGDGIRGVLRHEKRYDAIPGVRGRDEARWVAWLVDRGLPEDRAQEILPDVAWDERERVAEALSRAEGVARVAREGSLEPAIAEALVDGLGVREALAFIAATNGPADVDLRVQGVSVEQVQASLHEDGVQTRPLPLSERGLRVEGRHNLQATTAWKRGWIEVQDEGSQVLAELVDPDEGPIVDLCAGAGGKTLALAQQAPGARILATDVRRRALDELRRRAERAGVDVAVLRLGRNGRLTSAIKRWQASRVFVDAPCTGTGTLRRHPELRLRLDERTLRETVGLQRTILSRGATLVRPGGRLVYGTCSVLRPENEGVVEAFLRKHPGFRLLPTRELFGEARASDIGDGTFLQLRPDTHGTDGFFGAVLVREA